MNLKGKKVLVTGAGGFIGSHLTEKLVEIGASVRAMVKYNSRNDHGLLELLPSAIKNEIEIVMGDLRDAETVRTLTKDVNIVFHLGAIIAIPFSYIRPSEVIETNVMGTLNVLTGAKEAGVKKIIHTSTSEVFGTAQYIPIDEKHLLQGQSPYSASKIGADKIAESFYKTYDLPVATIRPFNTYGPRQSARAIIPTIITQALTKKTIYLGSLQPTRDLTYVGDTVDAFVKVAEADNTVGEVINIGSNYEISIGALAEKILALMGKNNKIISDDERFRPENSEVERLCADNSKARQLIGWEPRISLEDGLKKTIDWIKENKERYKPDIYNL